ncbi:ASKHA domain-containing protein [uncultured Megasphaera sp.]|uniref:ASKHA domain-containing protein n=1 Tax=uncultured Megasphaera sp. TaxID=165188 RepID=UPI0025F7B592|nr:ASKHA domain-containing protein [uncultured Megasphaera sp.]
MADIRIIRGQRIVPDVEQALRFAGYESKGAAWERAEGMCRDMAPLLRRSLQAKAVLAFTAERLYVILTLGAAVSRQIDRYQDDGDELAAVLFAAMADTCLFALEQQVLQQLRLICRQKGCGIVCRHEPGSDLPLSVQADAVRETAAGRTAGVTVNAAMALSPEKSMSLVFDLCEDPAVFQVKHDCTACPKTDCPQRQAESAREVRLTCPGGCRVHDYIQSQGTALAMPCGGKGMCGKCRVRVVRGRLPVTPEDKRIFSEAQLAQGWRLACKAVTREAAEIVVPVQEQQGFSALAAEAADEGALSLAADHDYGLAVDIGTTTLAAALVDCTDGKILATATAVNSQRSFGADVVSRIGAACHGKGKALQKAVRRDLTRLMKQLLKDHPGTAARCRQMAIAANTTMLHLLMGWPCDGLGDWPFHPVSLGGKTYRAQEVLGPQSPLADATVTLLPGMSTYVGADITAGIWQCGLASSDDVSLFVDLGTNGEMVLGNKDQRFIASAPAGPALEGGKLTWGTGSVPGAICGVRIERGRAKVRTIDHTVPVGICGTGILEAMAGLVREGLVDETGKLVEPYFHKGFPLASTLDYQRITLSQQDIREIQMAKSAIRAGIESLIERSGISRQRVHQVFLAGGFGYYLDPQKAAVIGLLPADLAERTTAVGNTSLKGAIGLLTGAVTLEELQAIAAGAEEIVLGNDEAFQRLYIDYLNF